MGQVKKYQIKSFALPNEQLDGVHMQNLLQPNLATDPAVFKNKNLKERRDLLRRRHLPRRDSVENLSFWTKDVKRKFNEQRTLAKHE